MEEPHDASLLRIFTRVSDRADLDPLYVAIVKKARDMHLAGATVHRGSLGFGQSGILHKDRFFQMLDAPVVVEIVDEQEKIDAFLPVLNEMMESGLVTLQAAKMLQYGRHRAGLLQRIKEHFGRSLHAA